MRKYNKGEWSEIYALMKIIYDGEIEITKGIKMKVLEGRISGSETLFIRESSGDILVCNLENGFKETIKKNEAKDFLESFLHGIKKGKGPSFEIKEIQLFLKKFQISKIKAITTSKCDIMIKLINEETREIKMLFIGVKSKIGRSSTILNASNTTNFIFKINNISKESVDEINNINKEKGRGWVKDKINKILKSGEISFVGPSNEIFKENLIKIDKYLLIFLPELLLIYYKENNLSKIDEIINFALREDSFTKSKAFSKEELMNTFLKLIKASLSGMLPSQKWEKEIASNGLIIVDENGLIKYISFHDEPAIDDFLRKHVKFETASTSRYKMGNIYKKDDNYFFNLNLQIRLI